MTDASSAHTRPPPRHANRRTEHDFRRAEQHSKLVGVLKKALPAVSGLMVFSFIGLAALSYSPLGSVSIAGAALKDGKLIMNSPKMEGFDKQNRAYDVNAKQATQNLDAPNIVDLESIDARLPLGEGGYAQVDAKEGTYDTENEKLNLRKEVVVKSTRGMDILLEEADIDMKSGDMTSDKPVKVLSNGRDISANAVEVEDNGKRVTFKKRVRMTIRQNADAADAKPENN